MKIIVYGAIALAAGAAGFALYRYAIQPQLPAAQPATAAVTPAVAPPAASQPDSSEADSAVPTVLPDFTLADLQGTPRSILSWPGKSMIVNFWATWCAPCRREIPLLKKIQSEHGDEGFQVVGVAVDVREDVVRYAAEIGIDYPVLVGEEDGLAAVTSFQQGSIGFPFTVFTDKQNRIVLFHLGEIRAPEADVLLKAVERVNSGELTPAAARVVAAKQLAALPAPAA